MYAPELNALTDVGLTEKQATIYLTLLKLGECSVLALAKESGIKRPTAYLIIEQLEALSFVSRRKDHRSERVRALSPYAILARHQNAIETFDATIPKLLQLGSSNNSFPTVQPISGAKSIEAAFHERLQSQTEILFWASRNLQFSDRRLAWGTQVAYMDERIKRKLWTRGIIPYEEDGRKLRSEGILSSQRLYLRLKKEGNRKFREFIFAPRGDRGFETEIWVYDNRVEFFSTIDFSGARIEHRPYANTMRDIFFSELKQFREQEDDILTTHDRDYLWG